MKSLENRSGEIFNLFVVETDYSTGGVIISLFDNICVDAAPIYRWMIGRKKEDIMKWKKITSVDFVEAFEYIFDGYS